MRLKMLVTAFIVASVLLALWLFANWYEWSMADFDCDDGYWECRRHLFGPTALRLGLPIAAWLGLIFLMRREGKRS